MGVPRGAWVVHRGVSAILPSIVVCRIDIDRLELDVLSVGSDGSNRGRDSRLSNLQPLHLDVHEVDRGQTLSQSGFGFVNALTEDVWVIVFRFSTEELLSSLLSLPVVVMTCQGQV